jgi:flagellar basal-body rod protein FlgF
MNGLYEAVQAMSASERRLDAVATNLANLGVTGYKRRGSTTQSFESTLRGQMVTQIVTRSVVDHGQGPLTQTGNDYDLALSGAGFFSVETPDGEAYTRNGKFRLDDQGVLQTQDGLPVAWLGGRGLLDPLKEAPFIDPEGVVFQGDTEVGRLKIANFEHVTQLAQIGQGYYRPVPGQRDAAHEATVRQGFLERSNVNAIDEMVSMISVQRSFESSTRMMNMIDQTYRRLMASR